MDQLGKYTVVRRLGIGGMAEVFLCRQRGIGGFEKHVVIKQIRTDIDGGEYLDMFLDEARVAANLTHTNIVQIFEVDEIEDRPHIVMEYVAGPKLSSILNRLRKLPEHTNLGHLTYLLAGAASGLHYAHNARDAHDNPLHIVHRDISPHNILITPDGVPKLFDFGVAKASSNMAMTNAGTIKGKIAYMAPEQLRAQPVDYRADIFAFGVCVFEATVGRLPWPGQTEAEVFSARLDTELPRPSKLVRDYPPELERIVVAATSRDPAERPDAAALAEALSIFATSKSSTTKGVVEWMSSLFPRKHPISSNPYIVSTGSLTLSGLTPPPARTRHRALVIGGTGAAVLAIAAAIYIGGPWSNNDLAPPPPPPPHEVVASLSPRVPAPGVESQMTEAPVPEPTVPQTMPETKPRAGTLTLTTRPNAIVVLDGVEIARGNVSARAVGVGDHELVVKIPGYPPIKRRLLIDHGRETKLDAMPGRATAGRVAVTYRAAPASQPVPAALPASPPEPKPTETKPPAPPVETKSEPEPDAGVAPSAPAKPSIDVAATRNAVLAQIGPIQQCYERGKMDDASLGGSLTARITVAPDGSVSNIQITHTTLGSHEVEGCITREIARWRLPKPTGGSASFSYPFVFE